MTGMKKPSSVRGLELAAAPPKGDPVAADWIQQDAHERAEHAKAAPVKPVRITLNITPDLNRQLQQWLLAEAEALGLNRIPQQDAIRIMIRVITSSGGPGRDPVERIRAKLREELG